MLTRWRPVKVCLSPAIVAPRIAQKPRSMLSRTQTIHADLAARRGSRGGDFDVAPLVERRDDFLVALGRIELLMQDDHVRAVVAEHLQGFVSRKFARRDLQPRIPDR